MSPQPHVVVCPSSGMGHLTPYFRLAATLSSFNCKVTMVAIRPTVSAAEANELSEFFSTHPHINCFDFHLPSSSTNTEGGDPFFLQFIAIGRSANILGEQLSSLSPPISAVFSDIIVADGVMKVVADQGVMTLVVITSSARFFSLMTRLPQMITPQRSMSKIDDEVQVPGVDPIPIDIIPPPFFDPQHIFTQSILSCCRCLVPANGILLNSFDFFEEGAIRALSDGRVLDTLPPVFTVGPLQPLEDKRARGEYLAWLDEQPAESVVYVSFGSRTAMGREQIEELGHGLRSSGHRFLWVVKSSRVDKEEAGELVGILGDDFLESVKGKGMVIKEWVNQDMILRHPAVGGFVTHCGWNSVMEATWHGMPMVAWPLHGDQRLNAEVAEKVGLAVWERKWGWIGERLVKREEIIEKVFEMMTNTELRNRATEIREAARKAWAVDGSSRKALMQIIEMLQKPE